MLRIDGEINLNNEVQEMKKWRLVCSTNGIMVDYEEIIESEEEPDFWTCQNIAQNHGCEFFHIDTDTPIIDTNENETLVYNAPVGRRFEEQAHALCEAIKKMASNENAIDNFESYLTQHFDVWMQKWANTPYGLVDEVKNFAEMYD